MKLKSEFISDDQNIFPRKIQKFMHKQSPKFETASSSHMHFNLVGSYTRLDFDILWKYSVYLSCTVYIIKIPIFKYPFETSE